MLKRYTLAELCEKVGKKSLEIRNLQNSLELPVPGDDDGYSGSYVRIVQKALYLLSFNVHRDVLRRLLQIEKKIQKLLNADSLSDSGTWYLDACPRAGGGECRLLLTGYNLGFPVSQGRFQSNLDFGDNREELFRGVEMGEDIRKILKSYSKLCGQIEARVEEEKPAMKRALSWSRRAFPPCDGPRRTL